MSKKFKQRLTAPDRNDNNYRHYTYGGYNYCIQIAGDSVLPNCVGYAWGRWRELLGGFHKLSRANAEDWYGHNDGYKRSQSPALGAVVCWRAGRLHDGSDGAGHVAIVEDIYEDGSILISNSDYGGARFYTRHIPAGYEIGNGLTFQGFIHPPVIFELPRPTKPSKSIDAVAREVIAGKWGNGQERIDKLTAAGYNYATVQNRVDYILNNKINNNKSVSQLAKEVLDGKWGNGADRKRKLENAGYNYNTVQAEVDRMLAASKKSTNQLAKEVLDGKWGNGADRKNRLEKAGYNYNTVQAEVDRMLATANKSVSTLATEVLAGKWGNGQDRINRLKAAGYDPVAVQREVDRRLGTKNLDKVAREVIRGDWGNGQDRVNRLRAAGYDPVAVQRRVDQLI